MVSIQGPLLNGGNTRMRRGVLSLVTSQRRFGVFIMLLYITAVINRACVGYSTPLSGSEQPSIVHQSSRHQSSQVASYNLDNQAREDESQWNPVPFHEVLGTHLESKTHRCEPVTLTLCKGMYYPNTRMPNMFHHETQEEAGLEAHQFYPLVQINCSEDLRFLLCSIYTPICIEGYPSFLPPCRSICERVKAGCAPIMQHYQFPWPDRMSCEQFPEYNNPQGILCMERNLTESGQTNPTLGKQDTGELTKPERAMTRTTQSNLPDSAIVQDSWSDQFNTEASQMLFTRAQLNKTVQKWMRLDPELNLVCQCECIPTGSQPTQDVDTESGAASRECSVPCKMSHFVEGVPDKFTIYWLTLWSTLCAVSTLLTITTFMLDSHRFQYPELPIIYLSTCYFMVSLGYLMRLILGHESVACDTDLITSTATITSTTTSNYLTATTSAVTAFPSVYSMSTPMVNDRIKVLRHATSGRANCAVVFLFVYFFGMASSVWWVILTFTWFLAAGLKWGSEAISKYSQVFHFIAWSVPTAFTALALLLSVVEGDPASGLCTIGMNRPLARILFLFAPCLLFLAFGAIFLFAGFVALFRIRGAIKLQRIGLAKTDRLETLMLRIGVFGLLYAIPNVTVLVCMGYELRDAYIWQLGQVCQCAYKTSPVSSVQSSGMNKPPEWYPPKPDYTMFLLKHFMSLIIGVTSGFWIWSHKTWNSWRLVCRGRCCPLGGGSQSGTVRLLPNTVVGELDASSKQNLVPWIGFSSAVSMHTMSHPGVSVEQLEERNLHNRNMFSNPRSATTPEQFNRAHPNHVPLPPVPNGNETYYYDRVTQTTTPLSGEQRRAKGHSNRPDASQAVLSPLTDSSERPMLDGSIGNSRNSALMIHPSISSISGFHSPGKSMTTTNNWSGLSSSGIGSGLTMLGHCPPMMEIDINSVANRPIFLNKRIDSGKSMECHGYPSYDTGSREHCSKSSGHNSATDTFRDFPNPTSHSNTGNQVNMKPTEDYLGYYVPTPIDHESPRPKNFNPPDPNRMVYPNSPKEFQPTMESTQMKQRTNPSTNHTRVVNNSKDNTETGCAPGIMKV